MGMANMTKIVGVIHKQCFVFWIKKVYECSDKQIFYRITIECIIFSMNSCSSHTITVQLLNMEMIFDNS